MNARKVNKALAAYIGHAKAGYPSTRPRALVLAVGWRSARELRPLFDEILDYAFQAGSDVPVTDLGAAAHEVEKRVGRRYPELDERALLAVGNYCPTTRGERIGR